jgi:hypothetical protein
VKIKYICYFIFFIFIFGDECIENWIKDNSVIINDSIFQVSSEVNNNKLDFYYSNLNTFRLEHPDYIIIANDTTLSKYMIHLNKLFIDNPDKLFNKRLGQILDFKKIVRKLKFINNNTYKVKNKLLIGDVYIYFKSNCQSIDSIYIKNSDIDLQIKNIKINPLKIISVDSLFIFDFKNKDLKVYDFR